MLINGKEMQFDSVLTVNKLLTELELTAERVVVEVNMHIIPQEKYATKQLDERDTIEIVGFVGGG